MDFSPKELKTLLTRNWEDNFSTMDRESIKTYRAGRVRSMNGDEIAPIYLWPQNIRRIFFKQSPPLGDGDTFQLILFFLGNGYSPYRAGTWILTTHGLCTWHRRNSMARKRIQQICWIYEKVRNKSNHWRYFDLDTRSIIYFNNEVFATE